MDPHHAIEIAYLLANGRGKQRMTKTIQAQQPATWLLLFLSSGEVTLSQHLETIGRKTRAGQLVRLLNLPADASKGLGAFQDLHGAEGAATFSRQLRDAALSCYGTPIRAFLTELTKNRQALAAKASETRNQFIKEVPPPNACGEVTRAAGRFGLIAAAGELASYLGITGWKEGEAYEAARRCFIAWVNARGTLKPADEVTAVEQVISFIQQHSRSRFQHECGDSDRVIYKLAGFAQTNQKTGNLEYLIFPEVFRSEVCSGYDYTFVAKALRARNLLITESGRLTVKMRLEGIGQRVFAVTLPDEEINDENN
jgi:putative DNA primase/helicase